MKKIISLLYILLPFFVVAQKDSLSSGMYSWKEPKKKNNKNISSVVLFEGKVHDMEWLQMSANMISPSKAKNNLTVPANEEHLLIIKSGSLTVGVKDSSFTIGPGSIALLMPGEKFSLQKEDYDPCKYYVMKYRSKKPIDAARGKIAGGSLVKDWAKIEFKPHDRGGVRNFYERPTAMCRRFEMHVTTLKAGIKSHEPHTHRAEEIILMIDGNTEEQIGDKFYKGTTDDLYYLGTNLPHAIKNIGEKPCMYFAFQFD